MTPRPTGSRTLLLVLAAFATAIVCCCGGCGLMGVLGLRRGKADDAAAKAFVGPALEAVGKNWRPESFHPYAAPDWAQSVSPSQEKALFARYAKTLGPLKRLGPFTSEGFYYGSQNGLPAGTRVTLSAPAEFAKADGSVHVVAAQIGGRWGIETLRIDSAAFLK